MVYGGFNVYWVAHLRRISPVYCTDVHRAYRHMPILIRISMWMPIQIRIRVRIGIKTMRILPQALHMLENLNFIILIVTPLPVNNVLPFARVLKV
jgi:hypothetical protein